METITMFNGNKQVYTKELPEIVWLTQNTINDVALAHVAENTDLTFIKIMGGYKAQPYSSNQVEKKRIITTTKGEA